MIGRARPAPELPAWPQYSDEERGGLIRALEQGQWWRMGGSEVDTFEREFAAYHGAGYALAVTNGTHALELALQVLGVGPGSEVIVPAFTFISSSQAAQRLGAVAVPVDIDPGTYCIGVTAAAAAVTPRTRAIMPVHMAGQVCDMDALAKLSADAGVPLIQDAAHAHGAQWQGKKLGELGSVAAFSFQNGKLMTAGEGGAVTFPDAELYELGFLRHSCGRPRTDRRYLHQTSGSNFRLNEFSAAVLRAQLGRLAGQIDTREERWPVLAGALADIPGVVPQGRDDRCDRNPHYMAMFRLPGFSEERRNAFVDALVDRGLPAFAAFRAIYRSNGFWETGAPDETVDEIAKRCPNTEAISADGVWLHHRTLLGTEEQMHQVAAIVAETLAEL
ncbi:3-amino-5-hydroxybenzoic acid synthase [Frankia sp. CcI156]|uniref:DegT/DnrJ/EryC1/StrS family aminotransferase n=1 Tax=Frankia TaxID=1854 RepID=UPI0003CFA1D9|nr:MULTISPECIES: DegT/DnrJ/EryC1/StrS family aminotransferase [Frankia]ETA04478.1 putative PLP-dependent enzyme possibly involved in cell wall biogenesis [Frankia sp. CcI6]KDA42468.1 putative PLP-dependent enzyme possibly involved in cell wall biogenesis [Frankia sp. BMG5.23]KEZ38024.1 putative PLP-dependent enzyme possibly involved in cell wall biogenesis [Frankia sp. CeD]OAA29974.1 3-amino-5-hydroxybenzoate synthase [Frankia casuarinae]OFB41646.1 3-amino-5-hydroxybenzoic acid synthase [Frank